MSVVFQGGGLDISWGQVGQDHLHRVPVVEDLLGQRHLLGVGKLILLFYRILVFVPYLN